MAQIDDLTIYGDQIAKGAKKGEDALNAMADSLDQTDTKITRATKSANGWVNSLDEVTKTAKKLEKAESDLAIMQEKLDKATSEGTITQDQASRALEAQTRKIEKLQQAHESALNTSKQANQEAIKSNNTAKITSYQLGIVADEVHKFADQVIAGGSATKAAFYQVPNIIGSLGGFQNALSAISGLMKGPGGIVAAAGAAAVALGVMAASVETNEQHLDKLSLKLRATRDDYNAVALSADQAAKAFSKQSGESLSTSRETIENIAVNPQIDSSQFIPLAKDARDVAALLGTSIPEAAKQMADSLNDPLKAAQDFAQKGLFGINAALLMEIKELENSGDKMEAWNKLTHQMEITSKNAADQGVTPLGKAWKELRQNFSGFSDEIAPIFQKLGSYILKATTLIIQLDTLFVKTVKDLGIHASNATESIFGSQKLRPSTQNEVLQKSNNIPKIPQKTTQSATQSARSWALVNDVASESNNSQTAKIREENEEITKLTKAKSSLNDLYKSGEIDTAQYNKLLQDDNEKLAEHRAALLAIKSPLQSLQEQQQKSLTLAQSSSASERAMIQAAQEADAAAQKMGRDHASNTEILEAQSRAQAILTAQFNNSISVINAKTQSEKELLKNYENGTETLQDYALKTKAIDMARQKSIPGTKEYTRQVQEATKALQDQKNVQNEMNLAQKATKDDDQIKYLQLQLELIGQNKDASEQYLAVYKEQQRLEQQGIDLNSQAAQADLGRTETITRLTSQIKEQSSALQSLRNQTSQTANIFENSLSNIFTGGKLNFKNVFSSIGSQFSQIFVKNAITNPLLNFIDGGNRASLFSQFFSNQEQKNASHDAMSIAKQTSSVFTGGKNKANAATGGIFSGLSGVGNFLGNIGQGFGIGNALASIGGNQTGGMIGSSAGSLIGAGIGSFIPGGQLIGSLIGGASGGLLGGLFVKKHKVWDDVIVKDGQLSIASTYTKHASDNVTAPLQKQLNTLNDLYFDTGITPGDADLGSVGWYKKGKKLKDKVDLQDIIQNTPLTSSSATEQMGLDQALPKSFDSIDEYQQDLQSIHAISKSLDDLHISLKSFDDLTHVTVNNVTGYTGDLDKALNNVLDGKKWNTTDLQNKANEIIDFVNNTEKSLLDVTASGTESLLEQVQDLQDKYKKASEQAAQYGLDAQKFIDKGNEIAQNTLKNENDKLTSADQSVQARYLTATGDDQGAALMNFDISAKQQENDLANNWRDYLGDSYQTNKDYLTQQADLEKTLGAERLQIQKQYQGTSLQQEKQYRSQAQSSIASTFNSLADYVRGLDVSDASPLSAQDQLKAANENLNQDYESALGGDYNALSRIQSDSQTYLTDAQKYYGSGTDYARSYQETITKLQNLSNSDTDKLTSQLMEQLSKNQIDATNQVKDAVDNLQKSVEDLAQHQKMANLTNMNKPRAA